MSVNLAGRSFVKLLDFEKGEIVGLLDLSAALKAAKKDQREERHLAGKNVALIFEKTSTRTRCAFEVAAWDQGAHTTYLGPSGSQIGHKESMKDTARVLGRMYDGIEYRGFAQSTCEELARHAGVPVWNGLTDEFHPTQILADVMTMREHASVPLEQIAYAYLGDARNNMGNSLLVGAALLGMDFRVIAPRVLWPDEDLVSRCRELAKTSGARLRFTEEPEAGLEGCDFVHTDVWVSMGEPEAVWAERIELLRPYQVNAAAMRATGKADARFMHCLPAFHDRQTQVGRKVYEQFGLDGLEVTDEVFESPHSIVFDQAENRLHTIKAVMVATLAGDVD